MKLIEKWFQLIEYTLVITLLYWLTTRLNHWAIAIITLASAFFLWFAVYDFVDYLIPANIFEIIKMPKGKNKIRKTIVLLLSATFSGLLILLIIFFVKNSYNILHV